MRTVMIEIAEGEKDVATLCNSTGLTFNSGYRAAAMERLGDFTAKLIVDTREDEVGYFVNVVVFEQLSGEVHQWVETDGNCDFWLAVNRMAAMGTMPLGDFVGALSRMIQIC